MRYESTTGDASAGIARRSTHHVRSCSVGIVALLLLAAACTDQPTAPAATATVRPSREVKGTAVDPVLVAAVRQLAMARAVVPLEQPRRARPQLSELGQMLLFDPILSGNRNIACATCHLASFATGDGKALSIGEGGSDFGPARTHPEGVFIPRNAPPLFNLGAMKHLFWDGRVQVDASGQIVTPAGVQLTAAMRRVFEFGPASVLGMFPVTNRAEMRGQTASGNELAAIRDDDFTAIWSALMRRLGDVPEYRARFEAAYPGQRFEDMTFAHASNAIGGFLVDRVSFANAPWDQFLRGDDGALTARQLAGAQTFLSLKCSICHNGATLSDDRFHDVAVAQIGPGTGDGALGRDDFGRMRVTGNPADRYLFRTTPLRNVELTAPYGHDGAIASLRVFVEHYSESDTKLNAFDPGTLEPALRGTLVPNAAAILAQRDTLLAGVVLSDELVDKLMDYMSALTDAAARDLSPLVPARVPSGLPVAPRRKP
jgi:cytochrome c peroxidase